MLRTSRQEGLPINLIPRRPKLRASHSPSRVDAPLLPSDYILSISPCLASPACFVPSIPSFVLTCFVSHSQQSFVKKRRRSPPSKEHASLSPRTQRKRHTRAEGAVRSTQPSRAADSSFLLKGAAPYTRKTITPPPPPPPTPPPPPPLSAGRSHDIAVVDYQEPSPPIRLVAYGQMTKASNK